MREKMEFIWGVLTLDGKGERVCGLETTNDITLIGRPNGYTLYMDIGWIKDKADALARMEQLLELFTAWMEAEGRDTRASYDVFPEYNGTYSSIEQAYGHFKLTVLGLRASMRVKLQDRLESHYGRPVGDIGRIPGGEEWPDFEAAEDLFSEGERGLMARETYTLDQVEKMVSGDNEQTIIRNRAKCLVCGEIVESTYTHDYKTCRCGNLSVDGGKDYIRRSFREGEDSYREMSDSKPSDRSKYRRKKPKDFLDEQT